MSPSRFRELNRKQIDGTISETESAEFDAILSAHAKTIFDTCPACNGAFSLSAMPDNSIVCPHCETTLKLFSTDLPGHEQNEIDPSIEPRPILGVFSTGYTVPGTLPCLRCGLTYPKNYECCPALFKTSLDLVRTGSKPQRINAIQFLDSHSETLINSLRGGFADLFGKQYRTQLKVLANELECGVDLQRVLENAG